MAENHSTHPTHSDNQARSLLDSAANKLSAIESLSRRLDEMRLAAGSESEESVSDYDMAALHEAIKALAHCALGEIEQVIDARQSVPALHVVA